MVMDALGSPAAKAGWPQKQKQLQKVAEHRNYWVYAILWELSAAQGEVVWGDSYYKGELQMFGRTDQAYGNERRQMLQDLCTSAASSKQWPVLANNNSGLSDTEWFYVISSTCTFAPGDYGTPGKLMAIGGYEWVENADDVSMLEFGRVEYAKAAGIKTVACISVRGGVVELGTTCDIPEDINVVHFARDVFNEDFVDLINPKSRSYSFLKSLDPNFPHNPMTLSRGQRIAAPDHVDSPRRNMLGYANMTSSYLAAVASEAIENYIPKGSSISLDRPEEPQVQTRIRNNQTTGPIQSSSLSKPDVMETRSLLHSAGKIPSSADDERQLLRDRLLKQLEAKDNSHHYTPRADRNQRRMGFSNIATTSFSNQHLFNWRQGGSGSSPDFPHEEQLFVADRLNDLAPGHKTTSYELSLQTISEPQQSSTSSSQDADSKRAREFKLPNGLTTFNDPSRQRLSSPETETMLNRIKGLIRIEKPTGSMIPGIERPIDELHVSDGRKIPRQSIKHPEPVALSFEDQLQSMSTHSWLPNLSMEVGSVSSTREIGTSETISQLTDLLDAPVVTKPRKSLHIAKHNLFAMDGSDSEAMAPNSSCKEVSNMKGDDHIQVQNKKPKTLDFFKEGWAMDAIDMRAATTDKQQATCNEGQLENNLVELKAKDNWSQYPDAAADCQVEVQHLEVQMPNCFKDLEMEGNSTTTFANVKHPVSTLQKVEQAGCEQPTSAKSDHCQTLCGGNASATEGSWQRLPDCITTPQMLLENTQFDPFDVNGAHTMGNSMPHLEVRMMEHEQVLVKLRAKDRIGLLMDLIQALWSLNLHVQHANIRTSTGNGNNVFAAKMAMSTTGKQTTQEIANAISKVFFIPDTMNLEWKVIIQKEPQAHRVTHEVEKLFLGLYASKEALVTQQSTSDQGFHVDRQVQGDEVGVTTLEQVATQVAQAEATYNSNDDLEEMANMFIDP